MIPDVVKYRIITINTGEGILRENDENNISRNFSWLPDGVRGFNLDLQSHLKGNSTSFRAISDLLWVRYSVNTKWQSQPVQIISKQFYSFSKTELVEG